MADETLIEQTPAPVETPVVEGAPAVEATPTPEADPIEALGDEGLRKHPKFQKALQSEADKRVTDALKTQETRLRAQLAQEARTAQDQQAIDDMSNEDYGKYTRENQRLNQYVESQRMGIFADAYSQLVAPLVAQLPEDVQKAFDGTAPRHQGQDGLKHFVEDVGKALAENGVKAKLSAELPSLRKAVKEEVLAELRGGQPNPDAGARSAGQTTMTIERWSALTPDERQDPANRALYNEMVKGITLTPR